MTPKVQSDTWLTEKRLRAHGLILAVVLWSVYAWMVATPGLRDRNGNLKGTDFLHFYTLGTLARQHRGPELYDMDAQAQLAVQRLPAASAIRYLPLYPPQVSILFAPVAQFSYGWALALWWVVSAGTYGTCCYAIWRACPNLQGHGATVGLLAVANPACFHLIAWGQASALALAGFTLMFFALRKRADILAGVFLGCLVFKPQLALAPAIVFLATGAWKVLAGALFSAAAELLTGVMYYGIAPLRTWLRMISNVRSVLPWLEPRPYQTHCLRTFWSMLIPWDGLAFVFYLTSAAVVLVVTIALWRRATLLSLRFSALLLATVLIAPHLTVYDLVVLAPAVLLISDWLIGQASQPETTGIASVLYFVYALPLIGPLARWTHLQLSVIAMGALMYMISKAAGARIAQTLQEHTVRSA